VVSAARRVDQRRLSELSAGVARKSEKTSDHEEEKEGRSRATRPRTIRNQSEKGK
jgi:hypothetical protein